MVSGSALHGLRDRCVNGHSHHALEGLRNDTGRGRSLGLIPWHGSGTEANFNLLFGKSVLRRRGFSAKGSRRKTDSGKRRMDAGFWGDDTVPDADGKGGSGRPVRK